MKKLYKNKNKAIALITIALLLVPLYLVTSFAQSDETINFQGKIVNQSNGTNLVSGTPSCVVAGSGNDTCDFRVRIYTASSGGTLLWSETHSNVEIGEYNGVFNLNINSVCGSWGISGCSASGLDWTDGASKYLQIEFDTDGNADFTGAEIFERDLISASAYSQFSQYSADSDQLDGISSEGFVHIQPGGTGQSVSAASADSLIFLNETGAATPDLIQLQAGGSNMFRIDNSGAGYFNSGIILGNYTSTTTGAIRWSGADFEGYDGGSWVSLTSGGGASDFLSLSDTPGAFGGANYIVTANGTNDGLIFVDPDTLIIDNFLGLSDTPNDFSGAGGQLVAVNSGEDALEYVDAATAAGSGFTTGSVIFANGSALEEDNTNFFWDDSSNELGLGTNTPSQVLDVVGSIELNEYLYFANGSTDSFRFSSGDDRFELSNDFIANADDSYAIGDSTIRWQDLFLSGGVDFGVDGDSAYVYYDSGSDYLAFDPDGDGDDEVVISDAGYIGIGTTSPSAPLTVDTSANPLTGTSASSYWNIVYDPTGGSGADVFNVRETAAVVNAGDGTNQARLRGDRFVLTNNSDGLIDQIYGYSLGVTNNGAANNLFQNFNSGTNTDTVNFDYIGTESRVTNTGTVSDEFFAIGSLTTNNGTVSRGGGLKIGSFNNNAATDFWGAYIDTRNEVLGDTSNSLRGLYNKSSNTVSISGDYAGFYNDTANTTATGNVTGLVNLTSGGTTSGSVIGISNDISSTTSTADDVVAFLNNTTAITTGVGLDLYGIQNNINGTLNSVNDVYGIYNDAGSTGTINAKYGIYSTEGTTDIYLNYNELYSLYTDDLARFDGGIQVGSNSNDVISTSSGSTPTGDLYFGDEQICTDSNGVCGGGGGSSPVTAVRDNIDGSTDLADQLILRGTDSTGANNHDPGGGDCFVSDTTSVVFDLTFDTIPTVVTSTIYDGYIADSLSDGQLTEYGFSGYVTNVSTSGFDVYREVYGNTSGTGAACNLNGIDFDWVAIGEYTGADLAENYISFDTSLEAGDVIAIDENNDIAVRKSKEAYDGKIFGIVSTAPAQVLGGSDGQSADNATTASIIGYTENQKLIESGDAKVVPVALEGRVPVKISLENGPIRKGDYLTASSKPGFAMKATEPGNIIGRALESFNGESYLSTITDVKLNEIGSLNEAQLTDIQARQNSFEAGEGMIMALVDKGFGAGEGETSIASQINQISDEVEQSNTGGGIIAVILFSVLGILILLQNKQIEKIKNERMVK